MFPAQGHLKVKAKLLNMKVISSLNENKIDFLSILNDDVTTARIPKEWGRYCFHGCLYVHTREAEYLHAAQWGIPHLRTGGGGYPYPSQWGGIPIPG